MIMESLTVQHLWRKRCMKHNTFIILIMPVTRGMHIVQGYIMRQLTWIGPESNGRVITAVLEQLHLPYAGQFAGDRPAATYFSIAHATQCPYKGNLCMWKKMDAINNAAYSVALLNYMVQLPYLRLKHANYPLLARAPYSTIHSQSWQH